MVYIKDIYKILKENPEVLDLIKSSFKDLYDWLSKPTKAPGEIEILQEANQLLLDSQFASNFAEPPELWRYILALIRNCVHFKGRGVLISNLYVPRIVYFPYRAEYGEVIRYNNSLLYATGWRRKGGLLGKKIPNVTEFYTITTELPIDETLQELVKTLDGIVKTAGGTEEERFLKELKRSEKKEIQSVELKSITHLQILEGGGFELRYNKIKRATMNFTSPNEVKRSIYKDLKYLMQFEMY